MAVELFLKFTDEAGAKQSVKVDVSPFVIGRGADCELPIASGALSRRHAEISKFADVFVISDLNSSNGSEINGAPLSAPVALKNADKIWLGAAVEMTVEIVGAPTLTSDYKANSTARAANRETADAGVSWKVLLIVAPILGVIVLVLAGVVLFALSDGGRTRAQIELEAEQNNRSQLSETANDDDDSANDESEPPKSNRRSANSSANGNLTNRDAPPPPIEINNELDAVERNALVFLRSASSDSNPVLSSKQVEVINSKIKSYKNSVAVRENVKAARAQKAQFEKIGAEHNLKPALIAAAALVKLGDSPGDAVATASQIAADLNRYAIVFGTELANDSLLTVAAFAQGEPPNAMRDRIANLTKNTPNASAAIVRTIWFLKENDKLSPPAFDFAVRFIAIGAMLQDDQK